jgi:hypothetical protein
MEDLGVFKIVSARAPGGALVGYLTFSLGHDVESKDLLVANQGAWFVLPGFPRVAAQMFDFATCQLRDLGADVALLHHRLLGRGKGLGRFLTRRGAVEIKHEYYLDLREPG